MEILHLSTFETFHQNATIYLIFLARGSYVPALLIFVKFRPQLLGSGPGSPVLNQPSPGLVLFLGCRLKGPWTVHPFGSLT